MTLAEFNGITDVENLAIGARLLIPMTPQNSGGGVARAGSGVLVPASDGVYNPVGTHIQSRNLSCEYAASYIATSFFGRGVQESVFIESVLSAKNPHYGYRGNIDGNWGNVTDYGVYPEALAPVLAENGYYASIFYSFGETEELLLAPGRGPAGAGLDGAVGRHGGDAEGRRHLQGGGRDPCHGGLRLRRYRHLRLRPCRWHPKVLRLGRFPREVGRARRDVDGGLSGLTSFPKPRDPGLKRRRPPGGC